MCFHIEITSQVECKSPTLHLAGASVSGKVVPRGEVHVSGLHVALAIYGSSTVPVCHWTVTDAAGYYRFDDINVSKSWSQFLCVLGPNGMHQWKLKENTRLAGVFMQTIFMQSGKHLLIDDITCSPIGALPLSAVSSSDPDDVFPSTTGLHLM